MKKRLVFYFTLVFLMLSMTGCNDKSYSVEQNNNESDIDFVIIDKVAEEHLTCASALEEFYEDKNYIYVWPCVQNNYMIVKYENGSTKLVSEALKDGSISITDLDNNNIKYYKREKN